MLSNFFFVFHYTTRFPTIFLFFNVLQYNGDDGDRINEILFNFAPESRFLDWPT